MGIRNGSRCGPIHGSPLVRTGWAFDEFPFMAKQVLQVAIAPFHGSGAPCDFQTAGDCVSAVAVAEGVFPAQALLLDGSPLGFYADILARIGSAVGFAERVPASNERDGLFVIHRHAQERLADIACRSDWIGLSVGP